VHVVVEHRKTGNLNSENRGQFPEPILDPLLAMFTAFATQERPTNTPRNAVISDNTESPKNPPKNHEPSSSKTLPKANTFKPGKLEFSDSNRHYNACPCSSLPP
jgi:hypothetical protein